ncbi:hypothetical protein PaeCFBP13512_23015 [Paenibacillus sp. CFBP13512]|uniref:hypothetical protein n=1 Tax=Paenibacillus sp. CFBP13512 TaxID=2184007 RepID=UPI0010BF8609|nr:hypothetical protein [Paenibacillus sp. CFBP13512]TKJ83299.1 hypothetical protein PaeCFBP13512_23015 [Paenibacillus sp. CFBP13512]
MYKELMFDATTVTGIEIEFNLFDVELKHDTVERHISYVKFLNQDNFIEIFTDSIMLQSGQE